MNNDLVSSKRLSRRETKLRLEKQINNKFYYLKQLEEQYKQSVKTIKLDKPIKSGFEMTLKLSPEISNSTYKKQAEKLLNILNTKIVCFYKDFPSCNSCIKWRKCQYRFTHNFLLDQTAPNFALLKKYRFEEYNTIKNNFSKAEQDYFSTQYLINSSSYNREKTAYMVFNKAYWFTPTIKPHYITQEIIHDEKLSILMDTVWDDLFQSSKNIGVRNKLLNFKYKIEKEFKSNQIRKGKENIYFLEFQEAEQILLASGL